MFDFKMTEHGDLDVENAFRISQCKVRFHISHYPMQRVRFMTIPTIQPKKKKTGSHKVSFKLVRYDDAGKTEDKPIEDLEEALQCIVMKLRTEEQDTLEDDNGTRLYQTRHNTYQSEEDLEDVKQFATAVVNEFLDEDGITVDVTYGNEPEAGFFRYQAVRITISRDGQEIYSFLI